MSRFFQVTLVSGSQQQPQKAFSELKTLEWWISGLMLDPLFFLISRLIKRSGLGISHSKVFSFDQL